VQEPFWLNLPYLNIYESITPDVLHQLYQILTFDIEMADPVAPDEAPDHFGAVEDSNNYDDMLSVFSEHLTRHDQQQQQAAVPAYMHPVSGADFVWSETLNQTAHLHLAKIIILL
ncbi:hypothetical protein BDZ97DRAFT_1672106, partial [Flammula alnicola]